MTVRYGGAQKIPVDQQSIAHVFWLKEEGRPGDDCLHLAQHHHHIYH